MRKNENENIYEKKEKEKMYKKKRKNVVFMYFKYTFILSDL